MRLLIKILFFVSVAPFTLFAGNVSAGPKTGGGGTVVHDASHAPILIDMFNIPLGISGLAQVDEKHLPSRRSTTSRSEFVAGSELASDPAFQLAATILDKWKSLPFDLSSTPLDGAMGPPLVWSFVDSPLPQSDYYRPASLPKEMLTQTAAYYLKEEKEAAGRTKFEVSISLPVWNTLPVTSQAGLLIHETLRQVQIGQTFGFDDETLQKATAIMMMCKPSLKVDQYLLQLIQKEYLMHSYLTADRFGSFESVIDGCDAR